MSTQNMPKGLERRCWLGLTTYKIHADNRGMGFFHFDLALWPLWFCVSDHYEDFFNPKSGQYKPQYILLWRGWKLNKYKELARWKSVS